MKTENEKVLSGNRPEKKFRAGAIQASVWKNKKVVDNKVVEFLSVSFERNYKTKEGEWNTTHSLRTQDLPKASLVIQKAYEYIMLNDEFAVVA